MVEAQNSESHEISWHDDCQPFSERFGDHFYSRSDGRAECAHVFIAGNHLPARWAGVGSFTIAELGFGTGLNFLETWRIWKSVRGPGQNLTFVSFEGFPLDGETIKRAISVWPELTRLAGELLCHWPRLRHEPEVWALDDQTSLCVVKAPVFEGLCAWEGLADAWFLDGFAPSRNPEMWSAPLMENVYLHTVPGGTFASYTSAGWVRRNLHAAGFGVRKGPGHAGKRTMIYGEK